MFTKIFIVLCSSLVSPHALIICSLHLSSYPPVSGSSTPLPLQALIVCCPAPLLHQWVFYLFSASALLWLPLWYPVKTRPPPTSSWQAVSTIEEGGEGAEPPFEAAVSRPASSSGTVIVATSSSSTTAVASSSSGGGLLGLDRGFWALMKRREVWAICIAQYTGSWGEWALKLAAETFFLVWMGRSASPLHILHTFLLIGMYGLLNWLPTFFSDFYGVEIADLGSYTLLPYIVQGGLGAASGFLAGACEAGGRWGREGCRFSLA